MTARAWADAWGIWHVRVSRTCVSPLIAARRSLRDELTQRVANLDPSVWRHPVRVPAMDDSDTIVYREGELR